MWYHVTCFATFYMVLCFAPSSDAENEIVHLAECPFQVEPIGCFADKPSRKGEHRTLPDQILNSRDILSEHYSAPQIQWGDFSHWLTNFVCKGAGVLFDQKPLAHSDYIGIQFYGEVWANLDYNTDSAVEFGKYGPSTACMNDKYQLGPFDPQGCGLAVGQGSTNYVYKVTRYTTVPQSCPFFESRGCWADPDSANGIIDRPMAVYKMNERDPSDSTWNGNLIDWTNWGKSYLAELLCRCADLAKQDSMKYFSIQFYGECWLTNEETYKRSGVVNRCIDTQYSTCDAQQGNKCKTPLCAGEWKANMVYELTDGPSCHHNPCQNNAECVINQDANRDDNDPYICKCPIGYVGKRCEDEEFLS